jgi:D-galactarolactone cycloisomerase
MPFDEQQIELAFATIYEKLGTSCGLFGNRECSPPMLRARLFAQSSPTGLSSSAAGAYSHESRHICAPTLRGGDYAHFGIRVNSIVPGATETPLICSNIASPRYRRKAHGSGPRNLRSPGELVGCYRKNHLTLLVQVSSATETSSRRLRSDLARCFRVEMKITQIQAVGLRGETPLGGWANEIKPSDCVHTLVIVFTDEGVTGWGSAFTNDALVEAALTILEPLYLGENALEPERVSEKLHAHTFWLGRGGSITHAISGIDIALWDILGKATGQPVGRLLGGRYRDRVRPYASILMEEPDRLSAHLGAILAQGFRAFKIGWGPFGRHSNSLDEQIVKAARDAVGPDSLLMVDAGASDAFWSQGYKWAQRTAKMLADYDVFWFEEPLQPDNLLDYELLRKNSPLLIAGGEVLTRRHSFVPWLQRRALDIVQPDVTKVGGISEERRIAWTAEENGVRFVPHGWNTALGLAADLQLTSAIQNADLVEYLTGSPFIDDLATTKWRLEEDGTLAVPEAPGLGISLDFDAVEKYTGVTINPKEFSI